MPCSGAAVKMRGIGVAVLPFARSALSVVPLSRLLAALPLLGTFFSEALLSTALLQKVITLTTAHVETLKPQIATRKGLTQSLELFFRRVPRDGFLRNHHHVDRIAAQRHANGDLPQLGGMKRQPRSATTACRQPFCLNRDRIGSRRRGRGARRRGRGLRQRSRNRARHSGAAINWGDFRCAQ